MDAIFLFIMLIGLATNVTITHWHKSKAEHTCKQDSTQTEE